MFSNFTLQVLSLTAFVCSTPTPSREQLNMSVHLSSSIFVKTLVLYVRALFQAVPTRYSARVFQTI